MKLDKLMKLMALTTSDNDNEALSALRQANKILKDDNKTWSDVLGSLIDGQKRFEHLCREYNALVVKFNELRKSLSLQIEVPKQILRRRSRRL